MYHYICSGHLVDTKICTNKTYIWVELQVVLILGKLIEVFEVHGLINNQQTGDAMSRPHANSSIQDNTK